MNKINSLISECNALVASEATDATTHNRLQGIVNSLVDLTAKNYDSQTETYADLRKKEPSKENADEIHECIEIVRNTLRLSVIKVLDAGTGNGRDLVYLNSLSDVSAIGIDNSQSFIDGLLACVNLGILPDGSVIKSDIRNCEMFKTETFDFIRACSR